MNVEQLLEEKQLKYLSQGKDCVIRCLSPDHEDIRPSLRIDRISGIFHCLSCGFKGNIFSHFGKEQSVIDVETARVKNKIEKLLNNINLELPDGAIPFKHDYKNIRLDTLLKYEAFTIAGIPALEDRIVFPIRNLYGLIKGFCARRIHSDSPPKYVFYPKHVSIPVFPAKPVEVINGSVIIVEGIFDALNLIEKGLPNAVCAFGSDSLTSKDSANRISYFKILGVTKVYIMFDGDKAGKDGAGKTEEILKSYFATEAIELPDGIDPGNLVYQDIDLIRESIYESN